MPTKRRFVSDVQMRSGGGLLQTPSKETLRAWGFHTDRAIVTWRDEVRLGVWIEGTALEETEDS